MHAVVPCQLKRITGYTTELVSVEYYPAEHNRQTTAGRSAGQQLAVCLCTKQEIRGWVDAEVEGRIVDRKDKCHEREGYNKEQEEKCVKRRN